MKRRFPMTRAALAHHEAGHAVASVAAFMNCEPLPYPIPSPLVDYVEISKSGGSCFGPAIYSPEWPRWRLDERLCAAMEWQLIICLAGGIAEAIHHSERGLQGVLRFAMSDSGMVLDMADIVPVLADLRELTGQDHDLQPLLRRTFDLLLQHWLAVEALASALLAASRIEGDEVEDIIALNTDLFDAAEESLALRQLRPGARRVHF